MTHLLTDINALQPMLTQQRSAFLADPYPEYQQRVQALKKLKKCVLDNQQEIIDALDNDFGCRAEDDTRIGEILTTVNCINYTVKHLKRWMKPRKKHIGVLFQPAKGEVLFQPLGVIGIIVPWNYPMFLALGPLVTAIAAGNRAMIKMSEYTPVFNEVLAGLLKQCFEQDEVAMFGGEADMAAAFSALKFDHLFFTGSTQVGKLVMQSAAKNLVPVTLELGGKSPAIIAPDMSIETAVERMIFGKTLNAGQTCVAPDYVFCPEGQEQALIEAFNATFSRMYPTINGNKDYTSVVSVGRYQAVQHLLDDAKEKGAELITLGSERACEKRRQMPLTLVTSVNEDMDILQEEIFGPVLPVMTYRNIDEALHYVNARPRPLALYIYSFDKAMQQRILKQTHAGGVCINDAAFHVATDDLPFGGVGDSGIGRYHGKEGFETFSHGKSILSRGRISFAKLLFPPFGKPIHKLVYKLFVR